MCYELERRVIDSMQRGDYETCFKVVDEALLNPALDLHLTKRMLVPMAYNIARCIGNTALMDRYAQLHEKSPPRRTRAYPDAT